MHLHKPHATSQPSRFSRTHRLDADYLNCRFRVVVMLPWMVCGFCLSLRVKHMNGEKGMCWFLHSVASPFHSFVTTVQVMHDTVYMTLKV